MGWSDATWGSLLGGLQVGGQLYSAQQSLQAARETNQTNVMLQRENRDWAVYLSNTEVQRRMEDLKRSGLNPILAAQGGGASSPNISAAQIENPGAGAAGAVGSALSSAIQARQITAQTQAVEAATRKTDAEASILEAEVPYSAANAKFKSEGIREQFDKLAHEVHVLELEEKKRQVDIAEYQPLVVQYQKLLNAAERAQLPEKEATGKFFETVPESKWIQIIKQLLFKK